MLAVGTTNYLCLMVILKFVYDWDLYLNFLANRKGYDLVMIRI